MFLCTDLDCISWFFWTLSNAKARRKRKKKVNFLCVFFCMQLLFSHDRYLKTGGWGVRMYLVRSTFHLLDLIPSFSRQAGIDFSDFVRGVFGKRKEKHWGYFTRQKQKTKTKKNKNENCVKYFFPSD